MHTWGTIFLVLGIFYLLLLILRPPWLYTNIKVKTMIKMMGKKGFDILFLVLTIVFLVLGVLFLYVL